MKDPLLDAGPRVDRRPMPHRPWSVAIALWVVMALAAIVAGCGSSSGSSPTTTTATTASTAPPTTTTTAPAATTTVVATGSGGATSTTTVVPTTTTGPAPAPPIPAGAPVVTAQDAVLKPPAQPTTLPLAAGTDPCRLLTGTAHLGGCGEVTTDGGRKLVWYVSDRDSPDPTAIAVYGVVGANLVQTLELPDPVRPDEDLAHVEAADLDGVPGQELVIGFRNIGTGGYLQLEVIGAAGTVVASVTVDQGRASVGPGVIDTWGAQYGPDDPNCCPGSFVHQQIVYRAGVWRLLTGATVSPKAAPAGQFP